MFLIKAGTQLQVHDRKRGVWIDYRTSEDRLYEKNEVWDAVAVANKRPIPKWALDNIRRGYVVVGRGGWYALCRPQYIKYVD